jgi:hypothetical protein
MVDCRLALYIMVAVVVVVLVALVLRVLLAMVEPLKRLQLPAQQFITLVEVVGI